MDEVIANGDELISAFLLMLHFELSQYFAVIEVVVNELGPRFRGSGVSRSATSSFVWLLTSWFEGFEAPRTVGEGIC